MNAHPLVCRRAIQKVAHGYQSIVDWMGVDGGLIGFFGKQFRQLFLSNGLDVKECLQALK